MPFIYAPLGTLHPEWEDRWKLAGFEFVLKGLCSIQRYVISRILPGISWDESLVLNAAANGDAKERITHACQVCSGFAAHFVCLWGKLWGRALWNLMNPAGVETKLWSGKIEFLREAAWSWQGQGAPLGCGVEFWQAVSRAGSAAPLSSTGDQQHLVWRPGYIPKSQGWTRVVPFA